VNCEPFIDAEAAAKLLCTSAKTVKRMAGRGEIPAVRIGRRWRFRASVLDEWMHTKLNSAGHPCPERSLNQ
jgi:excisionase family DNA binding protein